MSLMLYSLFGIVWRCRGRIDRKYNNQKTQLSFLAARGLECSDDPAYRDYQVFPLDDGFGVRCSGRQIALITYVEEDLEFCQLDQ